MSCTTKLSDGYARANAIAASPWDPPTSTTVAPFGSSPQDQALTRYCRSRSECAAYSRIPAAKRDARSGCVARKSNMVRLVGLATANPVSFGSSDPGQRATASQAWYAAIQQSSARQRTQAARSASSAIRRGAALWVATPGRGSWNTCCEIACRISLRTWTSPRPAAAAISAKGASSSIGTIRANPKRMMASCLDVGLGGGD